MIKKLELLRNNIDSIDNKILNLIEKRFKKVEKIGFIKNKYKIPSYIEEREKDIIYYKQKNNNRLYISDKFLENFLKIIMNESYNIENKLIKIKKNKKYNICIIGSNGKMGKIFKKLFIDAKYNIYEINSNDWNEKSLKILKNIKLLIISVPINLFEKIFNIFIKYISKNCILLDLLSNKYKSIELIKSLHKGPIFSIHPMFGPNIECITKQSIIICFERYKEKFEWIIKQFKLWGISLIYLDYKIHDKYMSYIQSLRYFIFLSYGFFLNKKKININKIFKYSTNLNKIFLSILDILYSNNNIKMYIELIFNNNNNIEIIENYVNFLCKLLFYIKNNNKNLLINKFIISKKNIYDKNNIYIKNINKLLNNYNKYI